MSRRESRSIGRDFRLVWLSVLVSSTGDGMFVTALPLMAAVLTRDPRLIAGITIATRLPWLVLALVTGAIADRMDRRRLMIGADLARLLIVGVLALLIVFDAANIWLLYVAAFLVGTGDTLHVNAGQAILPKLVEPRHLLEANARFGTAQLASAQFAGPPLGVAAFNAATALPFVADAVTFAGSAALVAALPDVHQVEPATTSVRHDVVDGLRFLWRNAGIRRITLILTFINFFYFAAYSLLVLYNDEHLRSGPATYSLFFVGSGVGIIASRALLGPLVARFGLVRATGVSFWFWAVMLVGMPLTSTAWVAVALQVMLGLGSGLWIALNTTIRQNLTPSTMLGRMNAAYRAVSWGVVPFGAAFGGFVAHRWGLLAPFRLAGYAMLPICIFSGRLLRPVRECLEARDAAH